MTLEELKQIKDSLDKGVIVSKATWLRVLDTAIAASEPIVFGKVPPFGYELPEPGSLDGFTEEQMIDYGEQRYLAGWEESKKSQEIIRKSGLTEKSKLWLRFKERS